jgi:hypothetical protein
MCIIAALTVSKILLALDDRCCAANTATAPHARAMLPIHTVLAYIRNVLAPTAISQNALLSTLLFSQKTNTV